MIIIERTIKKDIENSLFKGKIITVYGARRVGKTTLVKEIMSKFANDARYINCDLIENRLALESQDAEKLRSFLGSGKLFVLDEAQRVLNIGLALKIIVDTYPDIQIIATGSSSFDLSNKIHEPLTGRLISFILYPVSISEIKNTHKDNFDFKSTIESILRFGSYPEIVSRKATDPIQYLKEISANYLYKDVFEYDGLKKPDLIIKLLQLIAFQVGNEVSYNELATKLEVNRDTVIRYIDLLEKAFVLFRLTPFSRNLRNEIGKKNKIYFYDLGIRNAIVNIFSDMNERSDIGALWENLCILERQKLIQDKHWYRNSYFWRTTTKKEIDYIEEYEGKLYGYEFKWGNNSYSIPREFIEEYKNSSVAIINKSNAPEFLGL